MPYIRSNARSNAMALQRLSFQGSFLFDILCSSLKQVDREQVFWLQGKYICRQNLLTINVSELFLN